MYENFLKIWKEETETLNSVLSDPPIKCYILRQKCDECKKVNHERPLDFWFPLMEFIKPPLMGNDWTEFSETYGKCKFNC